MSCWRPTSRRWCCSSASRPSCCLRGPRCVQFLTSDHRRCHPQRFINLKQAPGGKDPRTPRIFFAELTTSMPPNFQKGAPVMVTLFRNHVFPPTRKNTVDSSFFVSKKCRGRKKSPLFYLRKKLWEGGGTHCPLFPKNPGRVFLTDSFPLSLICCPQAPLSVFTARIFLMILFLRYRHFSLIYAI